MAAGTSRALISQCVETHCSFVSNHTSLCRLFSCISTSVPLVSFSDFRIVAAGYFCFKKFRIGVATFSAGVFCFCRLLLHAANSVRLHKYNSKTDNLVFMTCCFLLLLFVASSRSNSVSKETILLSSWLSATIIICLFYFFRFSHVMFSFLCRHNSRNGTRNV